MGIWLAARTDLPVVGPLLDDRGSATLASWAGAAFDLTIVGWLLWRAPGRGPTSRWSCSTHDRRLFPIGMFPWVMIAAHADLLRATTGPTALRSLGRLGAARTPGHRGRVPAALVAVVAARAVSRAACRCGTSPTRATCAGPRRATTSFRVMLTEKAGSLEFDVTDPATGDTGGRPDRAHRLAGHAGGDPPGSLHATAHLVADDFARRGHRDVEVRADSWVSFNGRRRHASSTRLDLAALDRRAVPPDFVMALDPAVRE